MLGTLRFAQPTKKSFQTRNPQKTVGWAKEQRDVPNNTVLPDTQA